MADSQSRLFVSDLGVVPENLHKSVANILGSRDGITGSNDHSDYIFIFFEDISYIPSSCMSIRLFSNLSLRTMITLKGKCPTTIY